MTAHMKVYMALYIYLSICEAFEFALNKFCFVAKNIQTDFLHKRVTTSNISENS